MTRPDEPEPGATPVARPGRDDKGAPRTVSGMETWCRAPSGAATVAPPRWKMAVASGIAVLPVSLVANGVLGPLLGALPLPVRAALFAVLFSTVMTYLMMPAVTGLLRRWLYPRRPADRGS